MLLTIILERKSKKIRKEIINHLKGSNYFNIGNRSEAIKEAISRAEPNEIILIAGKDMKITKIMGIKLFLFQIEK